MREFNESILDIIKKRTSVRTYSGEKTSREIKENIRAYIKDLSNPFNVKVKFSVLESDSSEDSAKLGTYGVIKGAKEYIGAAAKSAEFDLEAIGYEFEKLMLYMTSIGIGTCWLGGTFKREEFAEAMKVSEDEIFPAISPFGISKEKRSITDSVVRFIAKGDSRKPGNELFFENDLYTTLKQESAEVYGEVLEAVRLAPSASNKQPWRIVKDGESFHFYEYKTPGYSKSFNYDIQRIDMGIALCHFELASREKGINGSVEKLIQPLEKLPENTIYRFTWIKK